MRTDDPYTPIPKGNAVYINRLNKIEILGLIREFATISRAELVEKSGLSAPTVSRIVKGLIEEEKLVESIGIGSSSGGRPPVMLKFKGEKSYVIGVDLGATATRGVLSNLNGEFVEEIEFPTRLADGYEEVLNDVANLILKLAANRKEVSKSRIFGVGIAVAGLVDKNKNIIDYSPVFNWHEADIVGSLHDKVPYPIIFDNVTRLMALGGLYYGKGHKAKNFICINVGYGIGSGVIVNGELLSGVDGFAGEFGHITMDKDSQIQCSCKKYGCLEALASGKAIAQTAQQYMKEGRESKINELCEGEINKATAKMVAQAARMGDELALKVFNDAMEHIGVGIANLINLFNPEMVVVGGGVSLAGDLFFENIQRVVKKHVMQSSHKDLPILPVAFGENAALMGAFALILNQVLGLDLNLKE
ncbi:MAG: ROK family transcriptional regulator [Bacteroidetes bacterium]|nr:ROK family transcriptional regulator [Bacteroidota bacterium]